jgi:hypothetical protein
MERKRWKITGTMGKAKVADEMAQPPLPPLRRMIKNLAKAGMTAVKEAIKEGRVGVCDAKEIERRQGICMRECVGEGGYYRTLDGRCGHPDCGCRMKYKRRLLAWHCPVGKW